MVNSTNGAAAPTKKPARGDIGPQTYAAVRVLIDKGMNKTDAFAQVAKETGRSAATVTTTYYRIAKKQADGGGVRRTARSARATATGQTERLAQDAKAAIDALHRHVASLEAQLEDLTEKSRELDRIKKVLNR
jgi:hypothetical protein